MNFLVMHHSSKHNDSHIFGSQLHQHFDQSFRLFRKVTRNAQAKRDIWRILIRRRKFGVVKGHEPALVLGIQKVDSGFQVSWYFDIAVRYAVVMFYILTQLFPRELEVLTLATRVY